MVLTGCLARVPRGLQRAEGAAAAESGGGGAGDCSSEQQALSSDRSTPRCLTAAARVTGESTGVAETAARTQPDIGGLVAAQCQCQSESDARSLVRGVFAEPATVLSGRRQRGGSGFVDQRQCAP